MFEHGESSRAREEDTRGLITDVITVSYATIPGYEMPLIQRDDTPEEQRGDFRDIQLDTIQPRMTETPTEIGAEVREDPVEAEGSPLEDQPALRVESELEEGEFRPPTSSPVWGGVTRFGGDSSDNEDDAVAESDPEEEPVGYTDDMGTTADDIIEALTERQEELEGQIHDLEAQNQVHQDMEDQYRGLAYQRLHESIELQRERQELIGQLEGEVTRSDHLQMERDAARAELQMVRGELALETAIGEVAQEAWTRATDRITELEGQVRDTTARIDTALFTFDTAMGRLRSRVRRYPRDEDMSRRAIDRRMVDHMIYQEHRDAVRRVTRD